MALDIVRTGVALCAAVGVLSVLDRPLHAGLPAYQPAGSFELLPGTHAYDLLPDGRMLTIVNDALWLQREINDSSFMNVGSITPGLISNFGASFLRLSPDGSTIAIGDNVFGPESSVLLLPYASLDPGAPTLPARVPSPNTEALWTGPSSLLVTGSDSSGTLVTQIDTAALTGRTVIGNVNGAAAGITSDGAFVYVGNGFSFGGPSMTGEIRAFPLGAVTGAATPLDFEAQGLPVADALTASSLGFDGAGNLLIGGGDFFGGSGDVGSAAVVVADAIALALAGGGIAPDSAELRLTPRAPTDSYFPRWNAATGELLITYFDNTTFVGGTTVYRYVIPAPGSAGLALLVGLTAAARHRRARQER